MENPWMTAGTRRLVAIVGLLLTFGGCSAASSYPPYEGADLDCSDVGRPVEVPGDDPHGLDADDDGVGCESW